jgi:uncharacterized membrane protein
MFKFQIEYIIVSLLLSLGIFTLFNYDVPFTYWTISQKIGTAVVFLLLYYNTIKNNNHNHNHNNN